MAAIDHLLEEALQLPERERGELAARLLRSLDPDDGDEVGPADWEAAWSAEIDERVRQVRDGTADLADGDEVLAELDAAVTSP